MFSQATKTTEVTSNGLAKTKPCTTIPSLDKIFHRLIGFLKNDTLF